SLARVAVSRHFVRSGVHALIIHYTRAEILFAWEREWERTPRSAGGGESYSCLSIQPGSKPATWVPAAGRAGINQFA
ncbi:MAG: hypothetical protein O7D29_08270, partial [Gemmatimonadetes bacterium]|nr:hypothetical protein [Gemmatimonadota bacterium]